MGFVVLTEMTDDEIYEGMLIDYYVSPLFGIKMKWQTEIVHVDFQKSFIDFQKKDLIHYGITTMNLFPMKMES
jgi:hypothetical protein